MLSRSVFTSLMLLAVSGQSFFCMPALAEPLQTTTKRISSTKFLTKPEKFNPATEYTISSTPPIVEFARYPLPDVEAHKWSHWGPGTVLPNGRVLTSLGDHRAINGNSYLYEFDPKTRVLQKVADLQSAVKEFKEGDFGFGKIHDRLNIGRDGQVYFSSFWGLRKGLGEKFLGERLFRYDPEARELVDLGIPAKDLGYPSSNFSPRHNLYYAEAAYRPDYDNQTHGMRFFVFDVIKNKVIFMGGHEGTGFGRDFFVDAKGNAYFNNGDRVLSCYHPETNELIAKYAVMPVSRLRRTVGPDKRGTLYAASADKNDAGQYILFSFEPQNKRFQTITPLWADTPAMALHPDGQFIYMVPGNVSYPGRPLIRADLREGSIEVIAFLGEAIQEEENFTLGGTYSLCVDQRAAYITFGLNHDLALVTVSLPDESK